ncbi:MAG: ATP-binding protein [Pseudomonadota bacterium]
MFWKNFSIGKKLFIAILATSGIIILFLSALIAISMQAGFSQYILEAELDRFEPVRITLEQMHDPANPGWPQLQNNRRGLNQLIRQNLPRPGSPPRAPANNDRRRPPPDPLQLGQRITLLDASGERIAGAPLGDRRTSRRAITQADNAGREEVIGYLSIAMPRNAAGGSSQIFLTDQLQALAMAVILALAVSAIAAYFLSRQFVGPVNKLKDGANRLASGEYDLRLDKTSNDEFGDLVDQFNALAMQLEDAEKAERQWVSDTSHELQTPLAVLRAEIEALQDGVRNPDDKTLATLHQSVLRISALVQDIGQLSFAREGKFGSNFNSENLSEIISQSVQNAQTILNDAGLTMESRIPPDIMTECDHLRIGQLIDNILANAVRYTSSPGSVRLVLSKQSDRARIVIEDSNSPPPASAMPHLFDRFYRAEASRARALGGSGLGLSICKAIVDAHGGTIDAGMSALGGLAISIELPLTQAAKLQDSIDDV